MIRITHKSRNSHEFRYVETFVFKCAARHDYLLPILPPRPC